MEIKVEEDSTIALGLKPILHPKKIEEVMFIAVGRAKQLIRLDSPQ